jgi:hypothetical protein
MSGEEGASRPNAAAATEDFEFAALGEAANYRRALADEFAPHLRGGVIEVGAGIGQFTAELIRLPEIRRLISVEPEGAFCARHRLAFPGRVLVEGTLDDVAGGDWDGIVSINVLEHIEEDAAELERSAALLRARHGHLCLFVPARPEIYAPIDRDFGHFRRYTLPGLRAKLEAAGFEVVRLSYFNLPGYFLWWLNFCLLKKRGFEPWKVRAYDRAIFPWAHRLESRVMRPPIGQSLIAVARAR